MSLSDLKAALGHAYLDTRKSTFSLPSNLYPTLSPGARFFVLYLADTPISGGYLTLQNVLQTDWSTDVRKQFSGLATECQIEVLAFLTAYQHELVHYLDLMATPFAANLRVKAVYEYLLLGSMASDFQSRATETLQQPLADYLAKTFQVGWAVDNPGADTTSPLARGQGLTGKVAFAEYTTGAPPRRVKSGWGNFEANDTVTVMGRSYDPVTVNGVWPTLRSVAGHDHVGPFEILEGRALTLVLRYIRFLLRDLPDRDDIVLRYVATFYPATTHGMYRRLLELSSGRTLEDLLTSASSEYVDNVLMLAQGVSWYALHGPPPISANQVASALPTLRLVLALKAWESDTDLPGSMVEFLNHVDSSTAATSLNFVQADDTLSISLEALAYAGHYAEGINRPGVRDHYSEVISCQREILKARLGDGYASYYGNPEHGNPLEGLDASLQCAFERTDEGNEDMAVWLKARGKVLFQVGVPMKDRAEALRSLWPNGSEELKLLFEATLAQQFGPSDTTVPVLNFEVAAHNRNKSTADHLHSLLTSLTDDPARLKAVRGTVVITFPDAEFPGKASPLADEGVQSFLRSLFESVPQLLYFLRAEPPLAGLLMAVAAFFPKRLVYDGDRVGLLTTDDVLKTIAVLEDNAARFATEHGDTRESALSHIEALDEHSRAVVVQHMQQI